jgi:release factor glutamine methyltransferase
MSRAEVVADGARRLEPDEARRFADLARRRREREPVAYILGEKGFRHLELKVDPRVLVPRPETEHVVEAALARLPRVPAWWTSARGRGRSPSPSRPSAPTCRWWPPT